MDGFKIFKIGFFLSFFLFMVGCSKPNLPKISETSKMERLSIDDVIKELDWHKFDDIAYIKSSYKLRSEVDNEMDIYLKTFCSAKNGKIILVDDFKPNYYQEKIIAHGKYGRYHANACLINDEAYYFIIKKHISLNDKTFDEDLQIILDNSLQTKESFKHYIKQKEVDKKRVEAYEKMYEARKEALKKEKNEQEKLQAIKANELQKRKGQYVQTFYDNWLYMGEQMVCAKKCIEQNYINTGYKLLQNALQDKWKFRSNISNSEITIDGSCTCKGVSVLMEKKE